VRKLLIANRGEIAVRIIASAALEGLATVAVYTQDDRGCAHVARAAEAVALPGTGAAGYLDIGAVIAAAATAGADAIHPGYGFLAENADFAHQCSERGVAFVGPSPQALEAFGDKSRARALAARLGIPVPRGTDGPATLEEAGRFLDGLGPGGAVMIKAVAGGGGRGMRLVSDQAAFPDALRSARSEAKAAFGDGTVILERAIENPRHIEIQVFGDRYGNAIHLGERDCSVQRRHQKLIEEAPSPAVSPKLRHSMGEVAVAAVRSLRYEGAGTLEFLLDRSGEFYFMEMNTRLQVEHPVTEAITGLDLVELQLRVARGEPLGLVQEEITFSGHAIEVRLCSEDAGHDFMPQSGKMARWQMPDGVRVEHALKSGAEIPPFYDSMIAKLIGFGATREEARGKLICALEQTIAFGVTTNQGFLISCLRHPVFARGEATTAFIGDHRDELLAQKGAASDAALAALLLYVTHPHAPPWRKGRSLAATFLVPMRIEIDGTAQELEIRRERQGFYDVTLDGSEHRFEIDELASDVIRFRTSGVMESVTYSRDGDRLYFLHRGLTRAVRDLSLAAPESAAASGGDGKVRAAMNGRVVAVLVKPGDRVVAGQPVMTLEAMKMEHVHVAGIAGTVSAIDVAEGEQVTTGKIVVEIEMDKIDVVPGK